MQSVITQFEQAYRKAKIAPAQSGDTVRVHQTIREGNKERVQVFEGVVIRTHRSNSLTANLTVRRIASGVGVEKSFMLHSPSVVKIEILRRSKVRRNFLSYMRERRGKSARLAEVVFDKAAANAAGEPEVPAAGKPLGDDSTTAEEQSTKDTRKEEISTEVSSEATKENSSDAPAGAPTETSEEAENAKVNEPKKAQRADKTATVDNAAEVKEPKAKADRKKTS